MAKNLNRSKLKSTTRILLIYTGGTIGMVKDYKAGVLKPIDFKQIQDEVPEIRKFNYKIDVESFSPVLDSANMQPAQWVRMAKLIEKHYNKYDGFVILHGSDTLAYTASALSFMLENLSKPVILTGSQLPVGEVRTDAKENLITSIEIAATQYKGKPAVSEVCVYFDYSLFRGNRVTKANSSTFEAFQSFNFPQLAEAGVHIKFNHHLFLKPNSRKLKVLTKLNLNIGVVRIYPGMKREWFSSQFKSPGLKAVILETFGSGNALTTDWFVEELALAIKKGILVLNITQCPGGTVEQGMYSTSAQLAKLGVLSGYDLTFESALTKLMFLLGNITKASDIKLLMNKSLRGEQTL